ncbi:MAG: hypothetical protein PPP58_08620 [Natronomonas sp.]
MELFDVGLLLVGLVLLFFGATISVYAVSILGFLVGAGSAYLVAPSILGVAGASGPLGVVAAVVAGGVVGVVLTRVALSVATAVPAFVVGAYLGLFVVTPLFTEGGLIRFLIAFLSGAAGAAVALTLTTYALGFVSAFVGAALASGELRLADFDAARETLSPDPILFDPLAGTTLLGVEIPLFAILFVLGILSQVGLFRLGWMTRLLSLLPGIGRLVPGR